MSRAPLLVVGVGNPSRGDDALGPMFVERLESRLASAIERGEIELMTDFQLQVEHALDLEGRQRVVFVDASVDAAPPFTFTRVAPARERSFSSHSVSPAGLLDALVRLGSAAPSAHVLALHGQRFELGEPLSPAAAAHLDAALAFFERALSRGFEPAAPSTERTGLRLTLEGTVQGVGLRPWLVRTASRLALTGDARNTRRGVVVEAFGAPAALDGLLAALQADLPEAARVDSLTTERIAPRALDAFTVEASDRGGGGRGAQLSLPPDRAPCARCLDDMRDPVDRHFAYAFTSCTACGPRLSVATASPFDRATTTMAPFAPCPACARAYRSPSDRRFHSQTLACPECGPALSITSGDGRALDVADPLDEAARRVLVGEVVAVQGVGAFHLVADAGRDEAVAELRRIKRRDARPFALMVATLEDAERLVRLDDTLREALTSPARPVVLAPEREGGVVSRAVLGPSRRVGVMLPYSPLHYLLARATGRPMVVTSANESGAPVVISHEEARARLGDRVSAFLVHDRQIARRVEDSVVARAPTGIRVIRRARGFAPEPVRLPVAAREPVLAVGGHAKSAACLVVGDRAFLTPQLGDLDTMESEAAWRRELAGFEALLAVRADVIAHDLHPEYASTRYAGERPARLRVPVQHHVAHALAAVAERRVREPVVAVIYDGTGFGTDGTLWGGEIMVVDGASWTRAASLRPLPLAGGERAIREVWRVAFAALVEAFGSAEALSLAPRFPSLAAQEPSTLAAVARMIDGSVRTVAARGVGRYFDAVGSLALGVAYAGFDGHVAVALEEHAARGDVAPYPVTQPAALALGRELSSEHEIDLRPTLRALALDLLGGASPELVSARVHRTLVEVTAQVVRRVLAETGLRLVVLGGGAFQNAMLEAGVRAQLGSDRVVMARDVPVDDGGLALGQAYAAVLALEAEAT